ncbi:MAG: GNAT family N-acetyltransferase [Anaerolineales bacterium]|nr:GNAT family N-acetyltransferase [Anaerolineales bacterium]
MSGISMSLEQVQIGRLRPLNIMRDLPAVADLVELCFQATMDSDGRRYVQQMRDASQNNRFLRWASTAIEQTSMPLSGYVWEEDKRIVGNISLIPFTQNKKRIYLLSNIAVHPDYRRHGIAQRLTEIGIDHARKRSATAIWLHVREDNSGAINLYRKLGFKKHGRRSTWRTPLLPISQNIPANIKITHRPGRFWRQQRQWLQHAYPEEITWYRMPNWDSFGTGLHYWLYRLFMENDIRQWSAEQHGQLQGVVSWMPTRTRTTPLWLAAAPHADESAISALLLHARRELASQRRVLSLDFPAGEMNTALKDAGFDLHHTLLWMSLTNQTQYAT